MSDRVTVGSSDVPAILGLSPWRQPVEVWAQLTGLLPRYASDETAGQRRGHIIEPALLQHFGRLRGVEVVPGPPIGQPPVVAADGWRSCRHDGMTSDGLVVEAKTTRRWDGWGAEGTDQVPIYYAAQVAWQLSVLDADRGAVVAYCPMDDEVRVYDLVRNRGLEAKLVDRVRAWMERHVWPAEPVQPAPLTYDLVLARHIDGGEDEGSVVEPDALDLSLARRLARVREAAKALEAEDKRLQAQICERIGSARRLRGIASWSPTEGRAGVDVAKLKTIAPDIYKQVETAGKPSRTFRFSFDDEE